MTKSRYRACAPSASLALTVLASVTLLAACDAQVVPRPNLLLITVSQLPADRLDCAAARVREVSPLCPLVERGFRFAWAIAAARKTAPAIASIFTSRHPSHHGVVESAASFLPSSAHTLAEELRSTGYSTAAVVSSPVLNRSRNLSQGFEVYDDGLQEIRGSGRALDATTTVTRALAWKPDEQNPWFLWVHFAEPDPPARDLAAGRPHETQTDVEAQIARLVSSLEQREDRPAVLLVSPRGNTAFGAPGPLRLSELRAVLLWLPAGTQAGELLANPVSTLDVAPTLLRAARALRRGSFGDGTPLPTGSQPLGSPTRLRPIFSEARGWVSVVAGREYYARSAGAFVAGASALNALGIENSTIYTALLAGLRAESVEEPALAQSIAARLEPEIVRFLSPESEGSSASEIAR